MVRVGDGWDLDEMCYEVFGGWKFTGFEFGMFDFEWVLIKGL